MEPAAEYVDPRSLVPWAQNPRHNDEAVPGVVESIRRFGFASPIIARRENREVVAGHTRLKAALSMGLESVPVRWTDLDADEAHALALADNKLTEAAEWDDTTLAEVMAGLSSGGTPVTGLGWTDEVLDLLCKGAAAVGDDEWGDALGALPAGDRAPIQSMTFTLHDEQARVVREALERAKGLGDFGDTGNANSNGNALARICELWSDNG